MNIYIKMVGRHQNNNNMNKIDIVVDLWIEKCIYQQQWKNYYDLHVTDVYGEEIDKDQWVPYGLQLLELANKKYSIKIISLY